MSKKYDMVVKSGEYESGGVKKSRWKTIGSVMDDGKGGMYAFLDASFNPAGIERKAGSESIMVSFFEPKSKTQESSVSQEQPKSAEPTEEIPF